MSDLIRREDVLNAFNRLCGICGKKTENNGAMCRACSLNDAIDIVEDIPTEEPLVTVKAKQNEGLYLDTDEETLLETEYIVVATDGWYKEYIHETDGKPRVGKWFDHSDEGYVECPFCGSLTTCEDNIDELHYCFNCGSKMKGASDE